jgi:uncharacterized protein (DUF486 family)
MKTSPEDLFTRRYNELQEYSGSADHYTNLKCSSILRQLLLDQTPLINLANKKTRLKIEFKVDNTFHQKLPLSSAILYTSTEVGNLVLKFSVNLKTLKLDKFLSLQILEIENTRFTVKEIIKFASNKMGGIHLDTSTEQNEKVLEASLEKLEKLKIPALAIAVNSIAKIVLISLRPLKNELTQLPDKSLFLALYDLENKGSLFFEGKKWMQTDHMNTNICNGFGWFGEVRIINQKYNGIRILYSLGSIQKDGFSFYVYLTKNSGIGCKAYINNTLKISTEIIDFAKSNLFNTFFSLGCVFRVENNISSIEIFLNGILISSKNQAYTKLNTHIDRHVIGGDLTGKRTASFYIKELALLKDGLIDNNISVINKYFERKYRK